MAAPSIPTPDLTGWFAETEDTKLWPGQRFALKVKNPLFAGKSKYQDILVFESETYGKVLVLDGVIQLTEKDEHAYQEAIAHIPLMAHPNPESVLILGAGDGGVLREVCRHKGVKRIEQCEIDEMVVQVSKKYLGSTVATSFEDPRVKLVFQDAAEFIKDKAGQYDVIIVDSSDPNEGPACSLFTPEFYSNLSKALKEGGVVCTQGECMWQNITLIHDVLGKAKSFFPVVDYAYSCVPTYPSGQIGFLVCSKARCPSYARYPKRDVPAEVAPFLRYYTPAIHRAAFVLPKFAEAALEDIRRPSEVKCHSMAHLAGYAGVALGVAALGFFLGKTYASRR